MKQHHRPSASSAKKKRTKKYFREAKRKQRARLREEFGDEGYRETLRDDQRQQRVADLLPVGVAGADGKFRFATYRGRRSRSAIGNFGRFGLVRFQIPEEVVKLASMRRSIEDLIAGRKHDSYSAVELQAHALSLSKFFLWMTAALEKTVGRGPQKGLVSRTFSRDQRRSLLKFFPLLTTAPAELLAHLFELFFIAFIVSGAGRWDRPDPIRDFLGDMAGAIDHQGFSGLSADLPIAYRGNVHPVVFEDAQAHKAAITTKPLPAYWLGSFEELSTIYDLEANQSN